MNHRMICYIVLWILKIEGLFMLLPVVTGLIYAEYSEALVYLGISALCIAIGCLGTIKRPENTGIYKREGFAAVALCWVVLSLFGAIPFVVTGEIPFYVDALFEIVSGFTTTGSSILTNVEALSHASLFWRSFSIWMGGMGVLVFALIFMPVKDGSRMNLMLAESPGPDVSKLVPRVKDTAIQLYKIYIVLTLAQIAALMLSGMQAFDSFCITFATAGTGGFSVLASSCAAYTALQQWIITVFMVLFGVNFSFYFFVISKRAGIALKMEEVRAYVIIIAASVAAITINIMHMYATLGDAVRDAAFQVSSIITTTGLTTTDYNMWPSFSKVILVALMFCGACAGSTGGGLKVSRVIILMRSVKKEIYETLFPKRVKHIRFDGKVVSAKRLHTVNVYLAAFIAIFVISTIIVSLDGFSFESNFTAVATTINNVGPGLDLVGPIGSFAAYSPLSKLVLTFDMLAGRLEIFPMLILFSPFLWRERS
jgi:trk system potassium uptake protein TrkH